MRIVCENFETCSSYNEGVCGGASFVINNTYSCGITGTTKNVKMIDLDDHGINPKKILAKAFPGVPKS